MYRIVPSLHNPFITKKEPERGQGSRGAKGAKGRARGKPNGAGREPKEANGSQGEPKGNQKEANEQKKPKGSRTNFWPIKTRQRITFSKTLQNLQKTTRCPRNNRFGSFWDIFRHQFSLYFTIPRRLIFCNMYNAKWWFWIIKVPFWHQKFIQQSCSFKCYVDFMRT